MDLRSAEPRGRARQWLSGHRLWGLLISLGVGAVSAFIPNDELSYQVALVSTLVAFNVALLIELAGRLEKVRDDNRGVTASAAEEVIAALRRGNAVFDSPTSCQAFLAELTDDWRKVEQGRGAFFGRIFEAFQEEFKERVHALAEGNITIDANEPYSFRRADALEIFQSLVMINMFNLDYWETIPGSRYLAHQQRAIDAGQLKVTRIFVLTEAEIDQARTIIRDHKQARVTVFVVRLAVVSPGDKLLLRPTGIITDDRGQKMSFFVPRVDTDRTRLEGGTEREVLSQRGRDITRAEASVRKALEYAEDPYDVYPNLDDD